MSALPSTTQIRELPTAIKQTVPAEFLDENQHMNIQHYMVLGSHSLFEHFEALGMGRGYIEDRGLTTFTAEQHLRYYAEARLDQHLSTYVRLLERSGKALHAMAFLINDSTDALACTLEVTLVHVNMESRRPVDFPADIADAFDNAIAQHRRLSWPAPVCGAMGIRQR